LALIRLVGRRPRRFCCIWVFSIEILHLRTLVASVSSLHVPYCKDLMRLYMVSGHGAVW
jgi:hypothetical protein